MALVQCRECAGNVSDKAAVCPACGAPVLKAATKWILPKWAIPVIALGIAGIVAIVFVAANGGEKKRDAPARLLPATEVDNPTEGTPEYVIQQILKAGMEKDTDVGWKEFRPWLHSEELDSSASEKNWREVKFESLARSVSRYLEDPSKPVYKIDYDEEMHGGRMHRWFLVNKYSDMPSPVVLKEDPKANGEWRVKGI